MLRLSYKMNGNSFRYFFFIGVLQPVKIISLILGRVNHEVLGKREISERNQLITSKQNLARLMWREIGSNTQQWDDERFRALKISILKNSATGAAILK